MVTKADQTANQTQAPQTSGQPQPSPSAQQEGVRKAVLRKFPKGNYKTTLLYTLAAIFVVSAGVGTGWMISGGSRGDGSLGANTGVAPGAKAGLKEAGIADEETFRDTAEGVLEEGGIDGEGTHHLVREGGPSQNAYLTSTVIDLQAFVGKKVQVWGETISAQKAGWLMDVGKIKVLE